MRQDCQEGGGQTTLRLTMAFQKPVGEPLPVWIWNKQHVRWWAGAALLKLVIILAHPLLQFFLLSLHALCGPLPAILYASQLFSETHLTTCALQMLYALAAPGSRQVQGPCAVVRASFFWWPFELLLELTHLGLPFFPRCRSPSELYFPLSTKWFPWWKCMEHLWALARLSCWAGQSAGADWGNIGHHSTAV